MALRNIALALCAVLASAMYPVRVPPTATVPVHVIRMTIKRVHVNALPITLRPVLAVGLAEGEFGVLFSDYADKDAVKVRS